MTFISKSTRTVKETIKGNLPLAPPEGKGTQMKMERMHDKHTSTLLRLRAKVLAFNSI